MIRIKIRSAQLTALGSLLLAACGTSGGGASSPMLSGTVHGGQSPVSGSTITLYAAGSGSAGATVLGTTATDGSGDWGINSFNCASDSTQVYVVASGGNPGLAAGTNNSALHLLAALGPCGSLAGTVNVNEVTTVAAAYALQGFVNATDPNNILDSGNTVGLTNAMGTAALLANPATGGEGPAVNFSFAGCYETGGPQPPNCYAAENINSLANALAACVNSDSGSSPQCTELFACAMPGASLNGSTCSGGTGTAPVDTLQAVLNIARNAGLVSMAGVYDVATRNAVFSPALMGAPTDWTLSLNITGGGMSTPEGIAIDAQGNVWVSNFYGKSLSEFSPTGSPISSTAGFTGGGLNLPDSLAIDANGNIWAANYNGNSLSEFSPAGTAISSTADYIGGGLQEPTSIAIDPSGNVWAANYSGISVSAFNSSGAALSSSAGFTGGGLRNPLTVAIDSNSKVWVTNTTTSSGYAGNDISELNPDGSVVSPSTGDTGGGLYYPTGIAIDGDGNVWVANDEGNSLSKFNATGAALSPASGYTGGGINTPQGVAIDAAGHVWVTNGGSVSEFDSSGNPRSPNAATGASAFSGGFSGAGVDECYGIAVDLSGNVWVVNNYYNNNSLTEFIGVGAPTTTPLITAITNGFTPQGPIQNQ